MNRKTLFAVSTLLLLTLLTFNLMAGSPAEAAPAAAPAAAITPVASVNLSTGGARVATFFDAESITADTRRCFDLSAYETIDLQYVLDITASQTVTLKLQNSNDNTNFSDGATAASAIDADGNAMAQYALFGRYNCIYADVTTANAVVVTVIGVAK